MHDQHATLLIDGSLNEGGGQVLRSSLTLSLLTGRPFRIDKIRAKRKKPGLLRQHLTAVRAAAAISDAELDGAAPGSQTLVFHPGPVHGGDYRFAIGTAGSCTLVLQTVLLPLITAGVSARLRLSGGTHNPLAPPADFLQRAYLPLLQRMGADVKLTVSRYGFFPAGGGDLDLAIAPGGALKPLQLLQRGELRAASTEALIAALPIHIAERELERVRRTLGWDREQLRLRGLSNDQGPGNALLATIEHDQVTEVFSAFGQKGISAERVAANLCAQVEAYLRGGAPVGPHLADQLMLPLAVAGGAFITHRPSSHTLTNLDTIAQFLPHRLVMRDLSDGLVRIESSGEQGTSPAPHPGS